MKTVSNNIKNALKQPTTQRKGRILVDSNYYDVFNVEYYADAYNEGNVIGNAIASQLDFDLPYMEKFDSFKYFDGVWTGIDYEYVDMGTFTVFDEKDEDDFIKHITAFDNLIKFNTPFVDIGGYPRTLFQELENVCEQAGVVLNNANIPNGNFIVENNQFVNEESLKTVLKAICQISGMYAIIKNDEIVLQLRNQTNEVMTKEQHEPITWKRQTYGINQVVLGMNDVEGEYVLREDLEDIAENGVHKLVINDNPFAYTEDKREELIDELFNQVKGFGYIPFEMNGEWLSYLDVGDTITIDGVETLLLRINGKSPKGLESVMSAPAIIDSSIPYINNTNSIENQMKRTEIIVDKQNQKIQQIASEIVNLSETITGGGQIQLQNAHEGILHKLSIIGQINLLFPSDDLYPSQNLYTKDTFLLVDDKKYHLDINYLNYLNNDICDEFIYEDGVCKIIRRIGLDQNGNMYELQEAIEEQREDLVINVKKESIIKMESFDVILNATYLLENEYTENFATDAKLSAEINVATNNINLGVEKKLNGVSNENGDVTSASIILAINEGQSEATINADKISLKGKRIDLFSDDIEIQSQNFSVNKEGKITATLGKIGGWNIGENELWCEIKPDYDYTESDIQRMTDIRSGNIIPTSTDYEKYDLDKNGEIDLVDILRCRKLINYNIMNSRPGKLILDTTNWFRPIRIENGNGEILSSFGVHGVVTIDGE